MSKKIYSLIFFCAVIFAAAVLIIIFRFIFPVEERAPLPSSFFLWHLNQGILEVVRFFPAVALSGLLITVSILYRNDSHRFVEIIEGPLLSALVASLIYVALLLVVNPVVYTALDTMRFKRQLFDHSLERARQYSAEQQWNNVPSLLAVCNWIWPENPEVKALQDKQSSFYMQNAGQSTRRPAPGSIMPGMEMTVSEALTASRTAFDNEQYSESHWFATFAGKIARVESPEADQAQEYANKAWEKIALVEPARMEREIAERYQRKQEGYGAAINGNWVDAYYIFQELSKTIPNDRDVVEYLAKSEETLAQKAFFIDEVDQRFGIPLLDLEFSLPLQSEGDVKEPRHAVLYISSLLTFSDFSLGTTVKIVVYNQRGNALYRISTPYMKILPSSQDSRSKTVLLLQAVNRSYKDERLDPFWEGAERPAPLPASLTLDMSYQDFLLLSQLQRHVEQLFLGELVASAWRFDSKEVQAELLYRIIDTAIFMILAVLAVGIGFRFRSRTSSVPYWLFPIITAVLVLLLYEGVTLYRMLLHSLGILSIVSLGFPVTIILFSVGVIVLLTLSLNSAVA